MRYTLLLLICFLLLGIQSACLFDSDDNDNDPEEAWLTGTIKDAEGNSISGAEVHIVFNDWHGRYASTGKDPTVVSYMNCETNGNIMVFSWTTASESNLSGFNIVQGEPSNHQVLNETLIAATNTSQAQNYSYTHSIIYDHTFWLEIIDLEGNEQICGPFNEMLSVEFSAFFAVLTAQHSVKLTWVTEHESGLAGFRVLRNTNYDLTNAYEVSTLISATNTNQTQTYSFTDTELEASTTYYYWLECLTLDGTVSDYGPISIYVDDWNPPIPTEWNASLYPNPSNSYFTIRYAVPTASRIEITVSSTYPVFSRTLVSENQAAGIYTVLWNGLSAEGIDVCSGHYQMTLKAKSSDFETLYTKTFKLLKTKSDLINEPVVRSTSAGYRIPVGEYFKPGMMVDCYDEYGNQLGEICPAENITICVKKDGYTTASQYFGIYSLQNYALDFVLQQPKKLARKK